MICRSICFRVGYKTIGGCSILTQLSNLFRKNEFVNGLTKLVGILLIFMTSLGCDSSGCGTTGGGGCTPWAPSPKGAVCDDCMDYAITCSEVVAGLRWKVDKKYIVAKFQFTVEGIDIPVVQNDTVTKFLQTEPTYVNELAPGETWVGFITTNLRSGIGPTRTFYELCQGSATGLPVQDTVFALFTSVDNANVNDTILRNRFSSLRYRVEFNAGTAERKVTELFGIQQLNGRFYAPSRRPVPTNLSNPPTQTLFHPKAGDIAISEIFLDPNGSVSEATGEWFEITNVSGVDLDIAGLEVSSGVNQEFQVGNVARDATVELPAGGILVFGNSKDINVNGSAHVDFAYGQLISLSNSSDEIRLTHKLTGDIDVVQYDSTFPLKTGRSLSLKDLTFDNNLASSWETGTIPYGFDGQFGTPGKANNVQADTLPGPSLILSPETGSLIITEFLSSPTSNDDNEWFEVYNPTLDTQTLEGLVIENSKKDSFTISIPFTMNPHTYAVFSRNSISKAGGQPVDYDYPNTFGLSNDSGLIRIRLPNPGIIVDEVVYNGNLQKGFPDFGDGIDSGWPIAGSRDGRSASLSVDNSRLSDPNLNNNDSSLWRFASVFEIYSGGPIPPGGFGSPGRPNEPTDTIIAQVSNKVWNLNDNDTKVVVDLIPQGGLDVNKIDTQNIRMFGYIPPIFVEKLSDRLRVTFNEASAPQPFIVQRNDSIAAFFSGKLFSKPFSLWRASDTIEIRDTAFPPFQAPSVPQNGDIIINEVMVNGKGDENKTEWVEVYNASQKTIDLAQLFLQDGGGGTSDPSPEGVARISNWEVGPWPVLIFPGQFKIIGQPENPVQSGLTPLHPDAVIIGEGFGLDNTADQVVLVRRSDGGTIDAVDYSTANGFPSQSATSTDGRSMSLISVTLDNSKGANWLNAAIPHNSDSVWGTPGSPNNFATSADIQISELYPDPPPGAEPDAEFMELINLSNHVVDLTGLQFTDAESNTFKLLDAPTTIVSGGAQRIHVLPGKAFVLGNSRGATDGVDNTFDDTFGPKITDYDYPNSFTLTNSGDTITIVLSTDTSSIFIDKQGCTTALPGKSFQITSPSSPNNFIWGTPNPTAF